MTKTSRLAIFTEALKHGAELSLNHRDGLAFNEYLSQWIDIRFTCVTDKDRVTFKKI